MRFGSSTYLYCCFLNSNPTHSIGISEQIETLSPLALARLISVRYPWDILLNSRCVSRSDFLCKSMDSGQLWFAGGPWCGRSCKIFLLHAVLSGCHQSATVTSCPSAILILSVHLLLQLNCSEEFTHQNLVCISSHTPSPCCPVTSGSSGKFTSKPTPGPRVRLVQWLTVPYPVKRHILSPPNARYLVLILSQINAAHALLPVSLKSILILSSIYADDCNAASLFRIFFLQKPVRLSSPPPPPSPIRATCPAHLIVRDLVT